MTENITKKQVCELILSDKVLTDIDLSSIICNEDNIV
jgi:hypothetical protein